MEFFMDTGGKQYPNNAMEFFMDTGGKQYPNNAMEFFTIIKVSRNSKGAATSQ
jgi:hypothetical protein